MHRPDTMCWRESLFPGQGSAPCPASPATCVCSPLGSALSRGPVLTCFLDRKTRPRESLRCPPRGPQRCRAGEGDKASVSVSGLQTPAPKPPGGSGKRCWARHSLGPLTRGPSEPPTPRQAGGQRSHCPEKGSPAPPQVHCAECWQGALPCPEIPSPSPSNWTGA